MKGIRPERTASPRADLALVGISAIWGFTFPAIQLALRDADPLTFVGLRFAVAAAVLGLVFRGRAVRAGRSGLLYGLLLGLCLAWGAVLQTLGLLYTSASKSAFITALYVILVPLVMVLLHVRLRPSSMAAVLLAAVGLYELTMPRGGFNLGDLLTLGCSAAFALHIIVAEAATARHDPVMLAFYQVLTTAACGCAVMLATGSARLTIAPWTVVALVVTSLFATALAFWVQMWAQRETSSTHAAVIFTAEPVFAAVFARLIQHERLGLHGLAGAALIVAGILVSEIGARRRG